MDIIFKFGEHYYSGEETSVWVQLVLTFTGASLGFLFALWISKINESRLKRDRFDYLKEIFSTIITSIDRQVINIQDFRNQLHANPQDYNLMTWQASNDIKRYLQLDSQVLFTTFATYNLGFFYFIRRISATYRHKISKRINDFAKINSHIDFIDLSLNQIREEVEMHNKSVVDDQLFIKNTIEGISSDLASALDALKRENPENYTELPIYVFLNESLLRYHQLLEERADFHRILAEYIDPFRRGILQNRFHERHDLTEILNKCLQAFIRYNDIRVNSEGFEESMNNYIGDLTESVGHLKGILIENKVIADAE